MEGWGTPGWVVGGEKGSGGEGGGDRVDARWGRRVKEGGGGGVGARKAGSSGVT